MSIPAERMGAPRVLPIPHLLSTLAAAFVLAALPRDAEAQTSVPIALPPVEVSGAASGSLTVPGVEDARDELRRIPGGVDIVPDTAFRNAPSTTVKDMLDYVPGVWAQPKWGEDTRLSIRGSGLSRNFHLRGVQLYMDGIPINTADGYGDFQEIDPSAYRHVEVYKGANALRFGANALGGAINFVTPSGRDAHPFAGGADIGAFGFRRLQASSGAARGAFDYFVTAAAQEHDGFRDHSDGDALRGSANLGYRIGDNAETRFYVNANAVDQRIPGSVTRAAALDAPRAAAAANLANDWQRNIETVRVANKTTLSFGPTTVEAGLFGIDRHLMHPIFQWLDYRYEDYGGFARMTDDRTIGGRANRLVAGVNALAGATDNRQFANTGGVKGALLSSSRDESRNLSAYVEETFYVLPTVALIGGLQFLHTTRDREDRFLSDGDQSGRTAFDLWSPKGGILWDAAPGWQVFANISRSAEAPSFGENSAAVPFTAVKPQTATSYELGTRGERPGYAWDVALYRADIENELQCLFSAFGNCTVTNADRTIHQGIEAGGRLRLAEGLIATGEIPDRVWLKASYTLNDFRFDDDPKFGDNALPGAPRHYLRAELLYRHPRGFYAGPNVEWVPQGYFVDSANSVKTDPYALLGLRAGYDGERFSAYLEGRNLADTAYIASASIIDVATPATALFEPGTGRAVYAGIRLRW